MNINKCSALIMVLSCMLMVGCKTTQLSELGKLERSIRKDLPFALDSLRWIDGADVMTFRFANQDYVDATPDVEIRQDGAIFGYNTFFDEQRTRQSEDLIWRNLVVSRKHRRVVCLDRYVRQGRTVGYGYVLQSEHRDYPRYGTFHWDVSAPGNMEVLGVTLTDLRRLAIKRMTADSFGKLEAPTSQDAYWRLMFHADSLYADGLYAEARQVYALAFTDERYILPSHLSAVAMKMLNINDYATALSHQRHRVKMEKDYYVEPAESPFVELKDTFEQRKQQWAYDLALKEQLEGILERDNHDRLLWAQAGQAVHQDPVRTEHLARQALHTDSANLVAVSHILQQQGFPRKQQVGEMAVLAVWIVFQHSSLEVQQQFLPQMEAAVARGDIAPAYLATLKDRIEVREGRPQKYGTQWGPDGRLAPLLDASRLNEWRQEVGLPPIDL